MKPVRRRLASHFGFARRKGRKTMSMSVSAIFGVKIASISPDSGVRQPLYDGGSKRVVGSPAVRFGDGIEENVSRGGLMIECSSRPQKKATAHHRKTRPKKTQPWDRNRGPTVYPPLPALPPEWSFVTDDALVEAAASSPPLPGSE